MTWPPAGKERQAPRLIVAPPGDWLSRPAVGALRSLVDAGADAVLVAPGADHDPAVVGRMPDALRGELPPDIALIIEDSPALAATFGAGVLLAERAVSTAEARRTLGPGNLLGRVVTSNAAAAAATGADFLVVAAGNVDPRPIVEAAWAPVLAAFSLPEAVLDGLQSMPAAGIEGVLLRARPDLPADELVAATAAVRSVLPPAWFDRTPASTAEPTILVDGAAHALVPDTAIADLLADLGRPGAAAVAVNGVQVPRRRWDDTLLAAGDEIEITGGD